MLKEKVHTHFYLDGGRSLKSDGKRQAYLQGADDCLEYLKTKAWHILTDDEESYPKPFEYVLVEDEYGDKNVACCYPDYDWHISNCEDSIKLIGKVIKWIELN